MSFPRIALHTGNKIVVTNKRPRWEGTVVLQHNETTATILKHGQNMGNKVRHRHPVFSTFQSNCEAAHWAPFTGDLLGMAIVNGDVPELSPLIPTITAPPEVVEEVELRG